MDRRLLPQHRLSAEQERDLERQGRAFSSARHAAQFGTMISGPVRTDMAKVRQRKQNMVDGEIALHQVAECLLSALLSHRAWRP